MSVLEVRRHAERGLATPLTPRGEQTARALAGTPYALVVSSPLASEQLSTWARIAARVGPKDRVLAISHGGIIELPIVALALELGMALDGPSFANLDGALITYDTRKRTTLELLRAPVS
jgi:broad specificity phosphatase PhoE